MLLCDPEKRLDWTILIREAEAEARSLKWFSVPEAIDRKKRLPSCKVTGCHPVLGSSGPSSGVSHPIDATTGRSYCDVTQRMVWKPITLLILQQIRWQTNKLCQTPRFDPDLHKVNDLLQPLKSVEPKPSLNQYEWALDSSGFAVQYSFKLNCFCINLFMSRRKFFIYL